MVVEQEKNLVLLQHQIKMVVQVLVVLTQQIQVFILMAELELLTKATQAVEGLELVVVITQQVVVVVLVEQVRMVLELALVQQAVLAVLVLL
jgi:hypothetical protein